MKRIQLAVCLMFIGGWFAQASQIAVVNANRLNVRGQATLAGEVVTQLEQGDEVTILEEITLDDPGEGEPPHWARIRLPDNTPVWVFAPFIDPSAKTVSASRLNLRAGPGENFSVLGRIPHGHQVRQIRVEGDWMEIEAPDSAYAFVATDFLEKIDPSRAAQPEKLPLPPVAAPTPVEPVKPDPASEPEPAEVVQTPVAPPQPIALPAQPEPAARPQPPAPAPLADIPLPEEEEDHIFLEGEPLDESELRLNRRIVRREGIVRSTISIQAPTYFELVSPETRRTINYLHSTDPTLKLRDYRGRRIVVTGEEGIDPRWPKIPLIEIETLDIAP